MDQSKAILVAAVLQEAGRIASSREKVPGPLNVGKVIGAQDIEIAIRTLETVVKELGQKNL